MQGKDGTEKKGWSMVSCRSPLHPNDSLFGSRNLHLFCSGVVSTRRCQIMFPQMRKIVASKVGTHHDIQSRTPPTKKAIYKAWGATSTCWCAYLASFLISRQKKTGVRGICESRDLCFEDAESSSWKLRAEAANSPRSACGCGGDGSFLSMTDHDWLVGGFKHFLFSISYMGCHPSHWLSYFSRC